MIRIEREENLLQYKKEITTDLRIDLFSKWRVVLKLRKANDTQKNVFKFDEPKFYSLIQYYLALA